MHEMQTTFQTIQKVKHVFMKHPFLIQQFKNTQIYMGGEKSKFLDTFWKRSGSLFQKEDQRQNRNEDQVYEVRSKECKAWENKKRIEAVCGDEVSLVSR